MKRFFLICTICSLVFLSGTAVSHVDTRETGVFLTEPSSAKQERYEVAFMRRLRRILGGQRAGQQEEGTYQGTPAELGQGEKIVARTERHFGGDMLWYGIQSERTNPRTLEIFKKQFQTLGMEIARFDVYWGLTEPKKGVFNWDLTDDLVNTVSPDTEILMTLYSTNAWGSKYNECRELAEKQVKRSVINEPPSSLPNNMEDYIDFLEAIVSRYKGRVKYWQIENEIFGAKTRTPQCPPINRFWLGTPEEYLQLLKTSYQTIKRVDPTATVFASSYTFEPWNGTLTEFYRYILDKGRNYTDLWDLHLYLGVAEDPQKIQAVKNEMKRLGYSKPLWSTESGEIDIDYAKYKRFKGNLTAREALKYQSEDLVKRYVQAFGEGVEKVFRLRVSPLGSREGPENRWSHMSLTNDQEGNNRRPAYYTYQIMYSKLARFDTVQRLSSGLYKFTVDGKTVVVAWSDSGQKTLDLSSHFPNSQVKLTHIITEPGATNRDAKTETTSPRQVAVGQAPIFIEEA
ncbi:MAG: hypothetical protein Kow0099_07940 [Candidatus Abyssubacteria bacterium]